MEDNRIIFPGTVKDIDDPLLIGRIRVEPKIEVGEFIYPVNYSFYLVVNFFDFNVSRIESTPIAFVSAV